MKAIEQRDAAARRYLIDLFFATTEPEVESEDKTPLAVLTAD